MANLKSTLYDRVKSWLLGNTWTQYPSDRNACPILDGDSRVRVVETPYKPHDSIGQDLLE